MAWELTSVDLATVLKLRDISPTSLPAVLLPEMLQQKNTMATHRLSDCT
jgi:hypothetical protein